MWLGALLAAWPAVYNRYPLIYPDSITYLADGRPVARALFLHQFSDYYGMRSLIYSLGILPFHWNVTPWPVVLLHALLAAFILWLVVRSLLPCAAVPRYLLLIAPLSLLTSLSWFVSLILPDVLGPLLYLCAYLLVFARDTLSRSERIGVAAIAWWAIASHITHLALAAGLCLLLALLWLAQCRSIRARGRAIGEFAMIVLAAAASLLTLHAYLYGEPSFNGDAAPFLSARMIADGPGRWYLEKKCPGIQLALCDYVQDLPADAVEFLWNPQGVWATASTRGDNRIRREEIPFLLATLRTYPREQMRISADNFWRQLSAFGLWDLDRNNWVLETFDSALPGGKSGYLRGWQANDDLPLDFASNVQYWVIVASLGVIVLFTPRLLRSRPDRLLGLCVIILPALVANAFLTGVFSGVEERYQGRAIWLLPLLAGLLLLQWLDAQQNARRRLGSATLRERG